MILNVNVLLTLSSNSAVLSMTCRIKKGSLMFSLNKMMQACKRRVSTTMDLSDRKRLKLDPKTETSTFDRQWEILKDVDESPNESSSSSSWFKFSVASYNVLSQNLLETNKYLYKKCHPKHLSWQYRKNLLKEELSYYQPDIICMQEVHKNEFSRFFLPELQKLGYFGLYKKRTSDKEDGCATFFKHDKFLCMSSKPMEFHCKGVEVLNRDNVGLLLLLKPVVNGNYNKISKKVVTHDVDQQLHGADDAKLSDEAKEKLKDFRLCVANTHLLFNPKRGDVKLAQLMTLMAGIDDLTDGEEQAVILCGDFNSQPRSGLYDFLLSGRLDCKDVAIKFFSGQVKPGVGTGDSLDDSGQESRVYFGQRTLLPTFLQKVSTLTDQCQFVDVIKKRLEKKRNLARARSTTNSRQMIGSKRSKILSSEDSTTDYREDIDEESSSLTDFISWSESPISYTQGSGTISHNLRLRSTYDHEHYSEDDPTKKEITCYLEKNCSTVDYIFFSLSKKILNRSGNETAENSQDIAPALHELHLLKRLKLWTAAEIRARYSGMPNADLGSDHTILIAQYGVKLT